MAFLPSVPRAGTGLSTAYASGSRGDRGDRPQVRHTVRMRQLCSGPRSLKTRHPPTTARGWCPGMPTRADACPRVASENVSVPMSPQKPKGAAKHPKGRGGVAAPQGLPHGLAVGGGAWGRVLTPPRPRSPGLQRLLGTSRDAQPEMAARAAV